ncbi:hypothetical protein [Desulfoplanes sp.]
MGAHDNEEIIDLTDVVEEESSPQSSQGKDGDFPHEQAIDPKDLEAEFEQLLQGSQEAEGPSDSGDDLDIESLFSEMEQEPETNPSEEDAFPAFDDEKGPEDAANAGSKDAEGIADLEDLFSTSGESGPATASPGADIQEEMFPAGEEGGKPDDQPAPEPPEEPTEEPNAGTGMSGTSDTAEEPGIDQEPEPVPTAESFAQTEPAPSLDGTAEEEPAGMQDTGEAGTSDLVPLQERIEALESRPAGPDQETLYAMLTSFFSENPSGKEILQEIASQVSNDVQKTVQGLVEQRLDTMDVPSSEEITAMVQKEIKESVAENMPTPPDSGAIVQKISDQVQQKVQDGMEAWEAERVALRQAIDALQTDTPQEEKRTEERLGSLAETMVTKEDLAALDTDIQARLERDIPAAAARIIREEIAALVKG